eukprot:TRINITY_DN48986_c0_g1_i1.p1 TRINITY_DN48986_c0_g1~~TRINITY_DN48986_c0_g1_i1.p1  ORF type:complete len:227 (-),score=42.52 TRINITY_DN48986_c0_g1_i1:220-900(-)
MADRERLTSVAISGRVIEWKHSYGWIEPQFPIDHPAITRHRGHIFVHIDDVLPKGKPMAVGTVVEFHLYFDGDDLGADECYARKVLRLVLPWESAQAIFGESGEWLVDFDNRRGVSSKAFQWVLADGSESELPFLLLEVWGHPQRVIEAVLEVSKQRGKRWVSNVLVPDSRLWKVNLLRLQERCSDTVLKQDLTIASPMPCRTLTFKGTRGECGAALSALVAQVCD